MTLYQTSYLVYEKSGFERFYLYLKVLVYYSS